MRITQTEEKKREGRKEERQKKKKKKCRTVPTPPPPPPMDPNVQRLQPDPRPFFFLETKHIHTEK